jgi:hypothetical protein
MNLERFETEFSKLYDLLKREGFPKEKDKDEIRVYGRFVSYHSELLIINSRLIEEIAEHDSFMEYIHLTATGKARMTNKRHRKYLINSVKLNIDLMDFYLYTRRFLDALNKIIKIHFIKMGKKNPQMEDTIHTLFKKDKKGLPKIEVYKQQIDFEFFWFRKENFLDKGFQKKPRRVITFL